MLKITNTSDHVLNMKGVLLKGDLSLEPEQSETLAPVDLAPNHRRVLDLFKSYITVGADAPVAPDKVATPAKTKPAPIPAPKPVESPVVEPTPAPVTEATAAPVVEPKEEAPAPTEQKLVETEAKTDEKANG